MKDFPTLHSGSPYRNEHKNSAPFIVRFLFPQQANHYKENLNSFYTEMLRAVALPKNFKNIVNTYHLSYQINNHVFYPNVTYTHDSNDAYESSRYKKQLALLRRPVKVNLNIYPDLNPKYEEFLKATEMFLNDYLVICTAAKQIKKIIIQKTGLDEDSANSLSLVGEFIPEPFGEALRNSVSGAFIPILQTLGKEYSDSNPKLKSTLGAMKVLEDSL